MYKEISKELKASLFQRIKSPFFGSFLIGLLIFNYRYVLVLLSTKSIEDKFQFIDTYKPSLIIEIPYIDLFYQTTIIYPLFFALFWIGFMPFFEQYVSMRVWKWHQNRLKNEHAKWEKEEIFLGSERDKYLNEIINIRKETNKLVEELANIDLINQDKIKKAIQDKEEEFKQEKERLNTNFEINLKAKADEIINQKNEEIEKLNRQINKDKTLMENLIDNHSAEIENKNIEITTLQNKSSEYIQNLKKYEDAHNQKNELLKLKEREILKDFSTDEIKFLKIIYKNNLDDKVAISSYINSVLSVDKSLKKIAIEKILADLIVKGLFVVNQYNEVSCASKLKTILYSAFNEQEI